METTHYKLHQWEPGDHFLRSDFNTDHAKIDAGIYAAHQAAQNAALAATAAHGAARAADQDARKRLIPVAYNVYQLALQNYYDSKRTDFKRAMFFDGFLNDSQIAQRSQVTVANGAVTTGAGGLQPDITSTYYGGARSYGLLQSQDLPGMIQTFRVEGYGMLKSVSVPVVHNAGGYSGTVTAEIISNGGGGRPSATGPVLGRVTLPISGGMYTFVFNLSLAVGYYALRVYGTGIGAEQLEHLAFSTNKDVGRLGLCYIGTNDYPFDQFAGLCALYFDHTAAAGGYVLSKPYDAGSGFQGARAWVRHDSGTAGLVLSLKDGGGTLRTMAATGTRDTVSLQGQGCKETAFALDGPLDGPLSARLELSCNPGGSATAFDYGVVLI